MNALGYYVSKQTTLLCNPLCIMKKDVIAKHFRKNVSPLSLFRAPCLDTITNLRSVAEFARFRNELRKLRNYYTIIYIYTFFNKW